MYPFLIAILLITSRNAIGYIFVGILVSIPFISIFSIWLHVRSKENKLLYKRRHFIFQDDFIKGMLDDNSYDQINWQNIIKVISFPKYYLIFLSKTMFMPIAKSSFRSEVDIQELESFLKEKNLL
ncbi:YcxB family protein [Chloroflexota bacterium]